MEFRDVLAVSGLTQTEAAKALGVDDRTVRRWCQRDDSPGFRKAPPMAAMALRYYLDQHQPMRGYPRGIAWLSERINDIEKQCRTDRGSDGWTFTLDQQQFGPFSGFRQMCRRRVAEVAVRCIGAQHRAAIEGHLRADPYGDTHNFLLNLAKRGHLDISALREESKVSEISG